MGDQSGENSVSPFTQTPQPATPVQAHSPSTDVPSKGLEPLRPPPPIPTTQSANSIPSPSPSEARDYWNGGKPHSIHSPPLRSKASEQGSLAPPDSATTERSPSELINGAETGSLRGRPSVQFTGPDAQDSPTQGRAGSFDGGDTPTKARATFMSRIKALAGSSSLQQPKSHTNESLEAGTQSANPSPSVSRPSSRPPPEGPADGTYDADADAEETADESTLPGAGEPSQKKKKKRRMRRQKKADKQAPSTPRRTFDDLDTPRAYNRLLRRRASMPDAAIRESVLLDEEARDRVPPSPWRTASTWMTSTMRRPGDDLDDMESSAVIGRRHGHTRRTTVFGGGGVSDGDAVAPRRPRFGAERASTYGAHKWKQVKSTLKLLRQKKEDRFDYYKSAELMAELRAGAPAVLMLASMIQRDEHGNKRIPVLLEQLKVRVIDSSPAPDDDGDRHWLFTIELEYGSGPSRMGWTVTRDIKDVYNLHFRYKFALRNEKYMGRRLDLGAKLKQPKFPYSVFPYLRGARKEGEDSDDDENPNHAGEETAGEATQGELADIGEEPGSVLPSDAEGSHLPPRKKSRVNLLGMRRRSTGITDPGEMSNAEGQAPMDPALRKQRYIEKQRRVLEKYLSEMIRWLMFRADSNRLCRFLELSALGVRLAAEGSYHGKEGYLHIQSSKGLDFRRVLTPAKVLARHSRKWFLVRQSYIVCVESPENMNIYDVYLVDSKFSIVSKKNTFKQIGAKSVGKKTEIDLINEKAPEKHHTLTIQTSDRQIRLFSRNQVVMRQFEESINEMLKQTLWFHPKRFDSFAPVRKNVFAQWLVDGRDYMWNVSRAINMARDVIYIHDWWLSPELYMRRPAAISQKWRLDRLLQKKAREGVKIFVIIYRNVEAAIPIDSEYTKFSLLNLHPNIFVQRSPNQFKKNQFFFAHHEKICVVDHDVAFVGGIDLCFGRWDTPQHPIVDDKPTGFEMTQMPKDAEHCQLFPGKDYSNPREQDFFRLNEPYEEMYDRSLVPRMPWHDISMQVVGQPARDLTRHFVQRWNYLRRGRKPTRPLPFLLPPPDANMEELEALGLTGTCEVQILRSATTWSLGIEETEHSIQNAYIKMIEDSDHFVYMENQFFITSTDVYGTRIFNRIGDALVERIIKAHQNDEDWRAIIVIPLMPGFQNTVAEQEGTSVRLILMCQYRSICRGESSIFGRLRAAGIEPEDYISFYSLRQWGKMANDALVTEQLYIHAKCIIVDDRVALIGSANINERSMLGSRDSECAAIVRDTDMIWSTMGGEPYQVARFAHTLRLRLMREHLGLDVDEILEQERQQQMDRDAFQNEMDEIYQEDVAAHPQAASNNLMPTQHTEPVRLPSFNHSLDIEQAEGMAEPASTTSSSSSSDSNKARETDPRVDGNEEHRADVSGYGPDQWKFAEKVGLDSGRDTVIINGREVLVHDIDTEGKGTLEAPKAGAHPKPASDNRYLDPTEQGSEALPPMPPMNRRTTDQLGLPRVTQLPTLPVIDDTDIGGPPVHIDPHTGQPINGAFHPMAAGINLAYITKDCMRDPINSNFVDEVWNRVAANNTSLYRKVFRCMPDSEVSTWAEYREYEEYGAKFKASMEGGRPRSGEHAEPPNSTSGTAAGAGVSAPGPDAVVKAAEQEVENAAEHITEKIPHPHLDHHHPSHSDIDRPSIIVPEGEPAELNEKQGIPERPVLDTQNINYDPQRQDPPSPVYPEGDTPFPTVDESNTYTTKFLEPQMSQRRKERRTTFSTLEKGDSRDTKSQASGQVGSIRRRRRATTKGSRRGFTVEDMPTRADAEELLKMIQGHVVQFPYDWLLTEEQNGNWGYQVDGVAPLAI